MFISDCYSFFFDLQAFEESFRLVAIESVVSEIAIFVSPTGNNEVVGSIGLTDTEIFLSGLQALEGHGMVVLVYVRHFNLGRATGLVHHHLLTFTMQVLARVSFPGGTKFV